MLASPYFSLLALDINQCAASNADRRQAECAGRPNHISAPSPLPKYILNFLMLW